uniref:Uncharacterized protein n=1 Tax=Oryza barthii TaxID=65489 RepID=A0A0D3F3S4_9ORYZ
MGERRCCSRRRSGEGERLGIIWTVHSIGQLQLLPRRAAGLLGRQMDRVVDFRRMQNGLQQRKETS